MAPSPSDLTPRARLVLGGLAAAGAVPVGWSMLTETVLPLWRSGAYAEVGLNLAGLPLILFGVGAFAWGGLLLVLRARDLLEDEANFADGQAAYNRKRPAAERRAAERRYLQTLVRLWRRPVAWLAGGFGLIACGSLLINWLPRALGLR